jgi:prevent-host-death family protein
MHKTVSATQARKEFFQLLTAASKPGSSITITLEGRPPVVCMSQEEFEGWQETLEVMADPALMKAIAASAKGKKLVNWDDLKKDI